MKNTMMNRRAFIKTVSVITAAVASIPSISMAGLLTDSSKLTDEETLIFTKILAVSLPTQDSTLVDPNTLPVIPTLEGALLAGMEPHIREGVRGGALYMSNEAAVKYGKPFHALDDAQATQFLDEWGDSDAIPQRALAVGLKKLVLLAYWAIPNTWEPIGYDGPVSDKWKIPKLGNTPEPQS